MLRDRVQFVGEQFTGEISVRQATWFARTRFTWVREDRSRFSTNFFKLTHSIHIFLSQEQCQSHRTIAVHYREAVENNYFERVFLSPIRLKPNRLYS